MGVVVGEVLARLRCVGAVGTQRHRGGVVGIIERKHGAQMLFKLRAALAVVLARVAVFLPVLPHPGDDQLVVHLRRLAAQHQIDLQRFVERDRIGHLGLDRPFRLNQKPGAEASLQRLPVGRFGS